MPPHVMTSTIPMAVDLSSGALMCRASWMETDVALEVKTDFALGFATARATERVFQW